MLVFNAHGTLEGTLEGIRSLQRGRWIGVAFVHQYNILV